LDAIIQRATAKNPAERYADTASLVVAFREAIIAPVPAGHRPDAGHAAVTMALAQPTVILEEQEPENPYKGLRAFREADAADFHGRDALVSRLLERMAEEGSLTPRPPPLK